jgi:hypothetical protein
LKDRIAGINLDDSNVKILPKYIKNKIIYEHLYKDIFDRFPRFFKPRSRPEMRGDEQFLIDIAKGLQPRNFITTGIDRIIYEED